jgi:hypothetical protein
MKQNSESIPKSTIATKNMITNMLENGKIANALGNMLKQS